jgi:hypothetical protein
MSEAKPTSPQTFPRVVPPRHSSFIALNSDSANQTCRDRPTPKIEIEKALINSISVRSTTYESIIKLLPLYEEAILDSLSKALNA